MALWILERTAMVGYDEYDGCVVRAPSEKQARETAAKLIGVNFVSCEKIPVKGETEIVFDSFNAG